MSKENKKLTEFLDGNKKKSKEEDKPSEKKPEGKGGTLKNNKSEKIENTDESTVCDCYHEEKRKNRDKLNELGINPPECGHCIAYLCNEVSPGSASTYNSSLRLFIESIHQRGICINDIDFTDVREYFQLRGEQERSKSTIEMDKSTIKGVISRFEAENKTLPAISWKISENIDASNYSTGTVFSRDPLGDGEIEKLLMALDDFRNQLIVLVGIETGPRAKAACMIDISDVNLEEKEIELKNTKAGGTYIMPLTDDLAALLEYWIENIQTSYTYDETNSYLFPSRNGGRISKSEYNRIVSSAAEEAGVQEKIAEIPIAGRQKEMFNSDKDHRIKWKVDVHTLRHTFSRLLKSSGVSKEARIYALDHSGDVTDEYGIDEEACREEIRSKFNGVNVSVL